MPTTNMTYTGSQNDTNIVVGEHGFLEGAPFTTRMSICECTIGVLCHTTYTYATHVHKLVLGQVRSSWSAHGLLWVFLCGLWLSSCALVFVCLMQSMHYLLWMARKYNDFLIRKWTWILHAIKAYLIHEFDFVYVVEAFIALNWFF